MRKTKQQCHMLDNDYSISIVQSDTDNTEIVNITGNITIDNSAAIRSYLSRRALTQDEILLNISESEEIDLSIIQILIGFLRARNKLNKKTNINFNLEQNMIELLNKSGVTSLISELQKNN